MIESNKNFIIPNRPEVEKGFFNPLKETDGADPCVMYDRESGLYYGINTTGDKELRIYRAKSLADLYHNGEEAVAYRDCDEEKTYGPMWAPELYHFGNRWYIYTVSAANPDRSGIKHCICLESNTNDPFDGFHCAAHFMPDKFFIDPTVYYDEKSGKYYMCYSPAACGDVFQTLAIAEMDTPTHIVREGEIIAKPELNWELVPPYVGDGSIVEGAYFVKHGDRLFILYSANGCWSDRYCIGLLEYKGGDLLKKESWEKYDEPIFEMCAEEKVFGPGHATFFTSPDGTETWICHHCMHEHNETCEGTIRFVHCQKVYFDETGFPHIGKPWPVNTALPLPSGE